MDMLILKFTCKCKGCRLVQTILTNNSGRALKLTDFEKKKITIQLENQDSMVFE